MPPHGHIGLKPKHDNGIAQILLIFENNIQASWSVRFGKKQKTPAAGTAYFLFDDLFIKNTHVLVSFRKRAPAKENIWSLFMICSLRTQLAV